MRRIVLSMFLGVALALVAPVALADINLNIKWSQDNDGLWSLSITPAGSFNLGVDGHARCQANPYYPCDDGGWDLIVGSKIMYCQPRITVPAGTTSTGLAQRMAAATFGKTCTLSRLQLDGTEKVCIRNLTGGPWVSSTSGRYKWPLYVSNDCGEDGGSGGGGTVKPPIEPLSCSLDNTIALAHGTLNYNQIDASQATYTAMVSCTRQATVRVSIANGGRVNFADDGSFYAQIAVMDQPGGAQFAVNGSKAVTFSSRLHVANGVLVRGVFAKSTVAVLDIL